MSGGHRLDTHRNSPTHRPQPLIHYLGGPLIQINEAPWSGWFGFTNWWVTDARRRLARISPLTAHLLSAIVGGRGHDLSERPVVEVVPPGCRVGPRACSQR